MSLPAISNTAGFVHEGHALDDLDHLAPHRTGIHPQPAANAPGDPLEEFHPGKAASPGLGGHFFIRAPAPQRMCSPSVSMATKGSPQSRTVSPRTPQSSTRKLSPARAPSPAKCSRQTRISAARPQSCLACIPVRRNPHVAWFSRQAARPSALPCHHSLPIQRATSGSVDGPPAPLRSGSAATSLVLGTGMNRSSISGFPHWHTS